MLYRNQKSRAKDKQVITCTLCPTKFQQSRPNQTRCPTCIKFNFKPNRPPTSARCHLRDPETKMITVPCLMCQEKFTYKHVTRSRAYCDKCAPIAVVLDAKRIRQKLRKARKDPRLRFPS